MDRYGEASRKFRRAVRRLIRMHISVVAFSPEPFSAYKCVGMEEACRAEDEEFEKILAKGAIKKGTSSSTHENREAHRDVRYDPADGLPLTKLELDMKYKSMYTPEELDAYWDEMPTTAPEQDSWLEVEAEDLAAAAAAAAPTDGASPVDQSAPSELPTVMEELPPEVATEPTSAEPEAPLEAESAEVPLEAAVASEPTAIAEESGETPIEAATTEPSADEPAPDTEA